MADTIRIVRGHKAAKPHGYVAPKLTDLFPDISAHVGDYFSLRHHLSGELDRLAKEGNLVITDIVNQGEIIRDTCGDIILGNSKTREMTPATVRVPRSLQGYDVEIRSVGDHTISWKLGRRPVEGAMNERVEGSAGRHQSSAWTDEQMTMLAVKKEEDLYAETDRKSATLELEDAWKVLRQHGMYCVYAPSPTRRADKWRYVEAIVADRVAANEKASKGRK
jgi:hypothetical protein